MAPLSPETYFRGLLWLLAVLLVQGFLLLLVCAWVQVRWERANRTGAHHQTLWEEAMITYLHGGARDSSAFGAIGPRERRLLIPFLLKVLGTVGGREGEDVRALYYRLGLSKGLNARLGSRRPQRRALAALEVGIFRTGGYTRTLLGLLADPTHHVAHVAAQGLADTRQLAFAEPVYTWVMTQELLQPGRQLELLERFGPGFMRWLEWRLDTTSRLDQKEWIIYAQLAASGRRVEDPSRLLSMLAVDDVEVLAAAIRALGSLGLRYPKFQVVVVNDGSKDDTLEKLIEAFRLRPSPRVVQTALATAAVRGVYESPFIPRLLVVDKENGGKADALNCGLNMAAFPLVCCMDGDSLLENDALLRITRPFLDLPNVVATAGIIRPLNGCVVTPMGISEIYTPDNRLARIQVVEYLRSFMFGRMGLSNLGSMFIVSGAFGVFRRDLLLEIGGFHKTIGEDFELVVRLHHHLKAKGQPYQIVMVPDSVCWTEVPEDAATLRRQRNRWQRGLLDSLWLHREMWFNPAFGRIGMLSMPYFLLFEAAAPAIELLGYGYFLLSLAMGSFHGAFAITFFAVAVLLGIINSHMAIVLEQITKYPYHRRKDWALLLWCGVLENFGYRQRTLLWRLEGIFDWFRGKKTWGQMKRKGIAS